MVVKGVVKEEMEVEMVVKEVQMVEVMESCTGIHASR